jgi:hypothetical protein
MAYAQQTASSNGQGVDPVFDPFAMPLRNEPQLPMRPTRQQRAQAIMAKHRQLMQKKAPWMYTYQLLGEFIMTRKQDFTIHITPGMFLTGKIFDSTAPMANHDMASSMLADLWPNASRSFCIHPPDSMPDEERNSKEVKEYFEWVNHTMAEVMDDPKCGLALALEEYMYDQGAFGISGIYVKENDELGDETPLSYMAVDAKKIAIAEDAQGVVDTCYVLREMTMRQVVDEYGEENVSQRVAEAFRNPDGGRQEELIQILHAVEPRMDNPAAFGVQGYPIASVHIEVPEGHIIKESGMKKMKIFITRFWKTMNEVYGRGPGMETMPDILEVNEMRENSIVAVEKLLNPPLLVLSDGSLGNQTINTSTGAISVHNVSGRIANSGLKPVEPLVTVGELKDTYLEIERLQAIIQKNFFIDKLTDLNNTTRQTLGEATIRNKLRERALVTVYARQISEMFSRLVEATFDVLYGQQRLGVIKGSKEDLILQLIGRPPQQYIPDAIAKLVNTGKNGYKIRFISPAARTMRTEELAGIQQSLTAVINMSQAVPDILDTINTDKAVELIVELSGANTKILHDAETIKALRQQRIQVQQQQAQMQQQSQSAVNLKHVAQSAQSASKAGIPITDLMGAVGGQQQNAA